MDEFVGLPSFVGGESQDTKFGTKYQYDYGRHIDVRKAASGFSVLPGPSKATGGVVTDLVLDSTQAPDGTRYYVGDSGNVYRENTSSVWSKIGNIGESSGGGILYRGDNDCIYITGQTKVARITKVSTAPTLDVNWFQYGISSATTCYKTGGTNTYPLPSVITESATSIRTYITDIEPLIRIGIKPIVATGTWTLTLHDDANNLLGTVTVAPANLIAGKINYFTFTTPVRQFVSANNYTSSSSNGRTYHFHLTSTVTTDTVQTTTASSLADCDMEYWANALVQPNNGLHPIYAFAQYTLIGNEKYIAAYEPLQDAPTTSDFLRHRLTFPPGYETNGIAQLDLYAAVTTEQRSTTTTRDFQSGKLFLWDAIQTTYNRYYDIPEGAPESLFSHKNVLWFNAGGALWESTGGQPVKVRTYRNMDGEYTNTADSTHTYPHMMAVRKGILLTGYPSTTTNQTLEHAVYGWGQRSSQYPMSWSTNYTMSTGSILSVQTTVTNLVNNPSFESGVASWTTAGVGATIAQDATQFYTGTKSLKLSTAGTGNQQATITLSGLTVGQPYFLQARVRASAAGKNTYMQSSIDNYSKFIGFNSTGGWDLLSGTITAANTSGTVELGVFSNSDFINIDAVMVQSGSTMTSYFDGSSTNTQLYTYAWTGTANASTSIQVSNSLQLGMVKNFGDTLYISWRDGTNYGVDTVNNSSTVATDFQIQLLKFDNSEPYKESLAKKAMAIFDSIPSGWSMRMWYIINNDGVKHYSTDDGTPYVTSNNSQGYGVVQITIPKEFLSIQVGLEATATTGTTGVPTCRGVYVLFDPQKDRGEISQ